jgi:hypothetical protein
MEPRLYFYGALLLLLACSWVWTAVRIARMAPSYGRCGGRWFLITLLFSALPATIVFWRDYQKALRPGNRFGGFAYRNEADEDEGEA